ncbi:spore coat protein U domain-containing protein [Sodalis sp. C49]|uniref:spore coat protein U domain-containing protein n=1 Tax=unclassified Sodalis (in: enterobacteria) TaxID=2636512 RepID=UPI003965A01F
MFLTRVRGAWFVMLCALFSGPALAYDCSIAATPLSFGALAGVDGATRQTTATLTVVCRTGAAAANVSYRILLDGPAGEGQRQMSAGGHNAGYQLYTSDNYQQVWGNGGGGAITDGYSLAANATVTRTYTVYARMRAGRDDRPGSYIATTLVQLLY